VFYMMFFCCILAKPCKKCVFWDKNALLKSQKKPEKNIFAWAL